MARQKRSASEMRLIRSASAYRRLVWKQGTSDRQREIYNRRADQLIRQADAIAERRAQTEANR